MNTNSYYNCDIATEPQHIVAEPAATYSYPLDPFQKHAIAAIDQEHNVLVCAKTGSGKTLVGEYQIADALKRGKRVFYTTPIKSLSNQKFHDLKDMYPGVGRVGIMTGDIKFCPDADIVIMTTEILRNMLYKQGTTTQHLGLTASLSLQGLGAVIFDECHYINDKDRGKVWEETMILLPRGVNLVLLSATLDGPELFAQWLSEVRERPTALIQTQYRVVPLTHSVLMGDSKPLVLMDEKENFFPKAYTDWLEWRRKSQKDQEAYQRQVKDARAGGHEGRVEGKKTVASFVHTLNQTIRSLEEKEMLPALAFVFSRKDCEKYCDKVDSTLLDSSDSAAAVNIFDFHLRKHKENLETIQQYHILRKFISRGLAFHHSGILPVLKEVIEILFSKGLIRLMFCTETFAVGINMPTKTVLFLGFQKYDSGSQGLRMLRTDEYIQMAGRAGRRGKDKIGYVFYLPDREPPPLEDIKKMMKGGKPRVQSRMDFGYDFLLKTLHTKNLKWIGLLEKSYWFQQHKALQQSLEDERADYQKKLADLERLLTADMRADLEEKQTLQATINATQNAKRKEAQRRLEQWKDTHMGAKWANAEQQFTQWLGFTAEIRSVDDAIEANSKYTNAIEKRLDFLQDIGFLAADRETLTTEGSLATEFNEGHPILCTMMAFKKTLSDLSADEIATCLAAFVNDSDKEDGPGLHKLDIPESVRDCLYKIGDIAAEAGQKEYRLFGPTSFWDLSTTWIEPVWRHLQGEHLSQIAAEYEIFEGNLVRTLLRVANLVEEWTSAATYLEDIDMLNKLEGLKERLVTGIVIPDSLYLHL